MDCSLEMLTLVGRGWGCRLCSSMRKRAALSDLPVVHIPRISSSRKLRAVSPKMLNDLSFNQDFTCLSVSTTEKHSIFNCDPFGEFYVSPRKDPENGATFILRMLFSTSLTIIVPEGKDHRGGRILKIYNSKQNLKICELTFPSKILNLMLNRKRLVVFLEAGQVYIYDLSSIRLVKVLEIEGFLKADEKSASAVIADLSADDKSYLVLPLQVVNDQTDLFNSDPPETTSGSLEHSEGCLRAPRMTTALGPLIEFNRKNEHTAIAKKSQLTLHDLKKDSDGWVVVYDTINLRPILIYKAHDAAIAKIAISNEGNYIATASDKGTIVRVSHISSDGFQTSGKLKITQIKNLRRGHNPARINALRFNLDSSILGCGSESGTIHLFLIKSETLHKSTNDPDDNDDLDDRNEADSLDDEPRSRLSSSEDLNENLANLLISKAGNSSPEKPEQSGSYFSALKTPSKLLNSPYAKSIMKKLPYNNYLETLIWEKPRRSFAYVKLPDGKLEHAPHKTVEIGFNGTNNLMVASYNTGCLYQYRLPKDYGGEREACQLLLKDSLVA